MKKLIILTCAQFWLLVFTTAQTPDETDYIKKNFTKTETYIKVRDGVQLFTSIYTPKDTTRRYPILLNRTPYSCAPYGADTFKAVFQNMYLAKSGYIFVFQDVRGRWMSEGIFQDIRPIVPNPKTNQDIDEASDTYDSVDWLVKNTPHNNGRVGVYGISYPGFYAGNAAIRAHEAVKAVSPQAPVTDWFIGDDFHHNGAFALMDAFDFYSSFGLPRPKPTTVRPPEFDYKTQDNYTFFLELGALRNANERYLKGNVGFWNDLMAHPNLDEFWKACSIRPHYKNIKPAILTVGGTFDAEDCFGAWETYAALEKQNPENNSNRIVMGPWFHGGWSRSDGSSLGNVSFGAPTTPYFQKEIESKFFNFYLKDEGKMDLPEATVFESGSNIWTTHSTWPPKAVVAQNLYLLPQGKLGFTPPTTASSFEEWVSDPAHPVPYTEDVHLSRTREYMSDDQRFAARRPDVVTFQTDILSEDLTLAGAIEANIKFSTTGTDADLVVKLIDVYPNDAPKFEKSAVPTAGYQMLVRGEILRGRFRNSFEKPEAFTPNTPTTTPIRLPDVAHTFKKGHRIMIQVQSSWFPLFDRNPQQFVNINTCTDTDFKKATHKIYTQSTQASFLKLPVLKAKN
jgi:uncharacterized protein